MKIQAIYDLEHDNTSSIYLIRDGNFFRAYEKSAMLFFDNITQYHVMKRTYKVINAEMVYLGFPMSSLDKLLAKHGLQIHSDTKDFVVLKDFSSDRDFVQWKASIVSDTQKEDSDNLLMQEKVLPRFEDNHPLHIYKMGFDTMVAVHRLVENLKKGYKYSVGEELKKDSFALALCSYRIAKQGRHGGDKALYDEALMQVDVVRLRLRLLAELHQLSTSAFTRVNTQIEYLVTQLCKGMAADIR